MKALIQFHLPGVTARQYDAVWNDLRASGNANPKGLLHHVGAQSGKDWVVVDLWESEEAFARFGEVLGPLLAKQGIADVKPTILQVHYVHGPQVGQPTMAK